MSLDMHMRVGSVSKPMLGIAVLRLVEQGKLSLDHTIDKYVDGVPHGEKITLRMLGRNTSGIFNTIENKKFQQAIMQEPGKQWSPQEIFRYTFSQQSYATPGEKWRYSNTNAVLLAMAVEKVTSKGYSDAIEKFVCRPLGLEHTGVPRTGKLPNPHPKSYRNGYKDKVIGYGDVFYDVSHYSAGWTHAAGDCYSTLDDLGKAARPIATGTLLSPAMRKEMFHWQKTHFAGLEYGFLIGKYGDKVGHTGDVPGFNAIMQYDAKRRCAVVVLTNLSNNRNGTMPAEELAKTVWAHLTRSPERQ